MTPHSVQIGRGSFVLWGVKMATRTAIPKGQRDGVLKEYSSNCAICDAPYHEMHHIDGDPTNHDALNLLPVCANHHNPYFHRNADPIDPRRVRLFRKYKIKKILLPQFAPLFQRILFLFDMEEPAGYTREKARACEISGEDLVRFVKALNMGSYYYGILGGLLPEVKRRVHYKPEEDWEQRSARDYWDDLRAVRDRIIEQIVELLAYQPWLEQE